MTEQETVRLTTLVEEHEQIRAGNRYGPQFFPQGTIVQIDCGSIFKGQLTVNGIAKNGPNSYVLEMFEKNEENTAIEQQAYHTCYVSKIIKRGNGQVKFLTSFDDLFFSYVKKNAFGNTNHYCDNVMSVIGLLVKANNISQEFCIDYDRLANNMIRVCGKSLTVDKNGHFSYMFNKKKTKKWFKQNLNRFLLNPVKAQLNEDNYMNSLMQEDYNEDTVMDMDHIEEDVETVNGELPPI